MKFLITIFILTILEDDPVKTEDTFPSVETPLGRIDGFLAKTNYGKTFAAFEGIPYAEPPIGDLKFESPKPVKPWLGVWKANTMYKCLQYNHFTEPGDDFVIGEEDCLYVNIYTPVNANKNSNLDVIIFIHGGAFMFNYGGSYGPKIIMDRNVVYVNFNYRLGPLGFLSTEDEIVPGNVGLRDQILALKFIKDNIQYFGGNPDSITLTGMSAGGASVHIHYMSPLSKGLFNRGFSQSGCALNPWVIMENGREKALKLADILGCPTENTKIAVECLKSRPGRQIVDSVKHFLPWLYNPFSPFGVVVDKASKNPVLPEHPLDLMKKRKVQDLPYIFSHVLEEGLYPAYDFWNDKYLSEIDANWSELIPFVLDYNNTISPGERDEVSKTIREFYLKDKSVNKNTFKDLVKIVSDRLFISDIQKCARMQSAAMKSPVYYYHFTYRGKFSKSIVRMKENLENVGPSHADDTIYVLSSTINTQSTPEDKEMCNEFLNMWLSFASNSHPKLPDDVDWPTVSKDVQDPLIYAEIRSPDDVVILSDDNLGNHKFWSSLPINENERILTLIKEEL
uniref:Carboxylic ester hydrolase n=1 Tax=Lasioderma serricorne TaxID=295660 RepID=A0A3G1VUC6_9COLE|nr:carboxylesterase CarEB2 [Lasioderma serricorne]